MLRSVQVRNDLGVWKTDIPLANTVYTHSYFIKNIEGLGPTEATIAMSSFANYDGGVFHAARAGSRNIVMTIGYNPNYSEGKTVEFLRKEMYKFFPPKSKVQLRFVDTVSETLMVEGWVESVKPNIFVKDPEIQISIVCEDAFLSSLTSVSLSCVAGTSVDVSTYGDADYGFKATFELSANISSLRFQNGIDPDILFRMPFASGDKIVISTRPGSKYAILTRGSSDERILDKLVDSTLQMNLNERVTDFKVITSNNTPVRYTLSFTPKWLGI